MRDRRGGVDDSLTSAFVREMKAAIQQREAAKTKAQRRTIDKAMREIMRKHLGPGAWRSMRQPEPRSPMLGRVRRLDPDEIGFDAKLAAAGRDED